VSLRWDPPESQDRHRFGVVWAAAYKTKNKFAGGLVLWQSKSDSYGANMKYMIIVYTMLNSSGEFPNPAFGIGGWLTQGVGALYGEGYSTRILSQYLTQTNLL